MSPLVSVNQAQPCNMGPLSELRDGAHLTQKAQVTIARPSVWHIYRLNKLP